MLLRFAVIAVLQMSAPWAFGDECDLSEDPDWIGLVDERVSRANLESLELSPEARREMRQVKMRLEESICRLSQQDSLDVDLLSHPEILEDFERLQVLVAEHDGVYYYGFEIWRLLKGLFRLISPPDTDHPTAATYLGIRG